MRVSASPAFANRRANPYNALLYDALVARGVEVVEFDPRRVLRQRPDVVHVHWPEAALNKPRRRAAAFRALQLVALLVVLRRRGSRLVWTVHNVRSHFQRYPRAERLFWRRFVPLVDGWISLSESAADQARQAHPGLRDRPAAVVPHGHYRTAYPDAIARREPTDTRTLLFFGRVKPYKGVPELLAAFGALQDEAARLVVAGRCDEAALQRELERAASDPRVALRLHEVPDAELAALVRSADLVVLPFRDVLNSGSALAALSFDAPVLVPATGALRDLADQVPGWVTTYDGPLTAGVLEQALARPRPPGRPDLSRFEWDEVAARTEDLYTTVLRHDRSR